MRFLAAALALTLAGPAAPEDTYDVVVYGGTSAGVVAAVQAVRMGKSAVLIEPGRHLGGLTSGGLGLTDSGNKSVIGGISREFYRRVKKHYDDPAAWRQEKPGQFRSYNPRSRDIWRFEPHVAEKVYREMIREAKIPVVFGERLDLKRGVRREGTRIVEIAMESGRTFRGKIFIDATYEGDLLPGAGVSTHVGREPNSRHGESLNGVQTRRAVSHQFVRPVDPYVRPGDPSSGVIPRVQAGSPGKEGTGDKRVQAYCFRVCMTDVPENRVPWPKPDGYDENQYELLFRNFEAGDMRLPWKPDMMPNRKTDTNNKHAFSMDNIGMNYDYPEGDYATRERIIKEHEVYQKGLLWSLANHPRVPEKVRAVFSRWGLAKDEFTDNGNWPHQLYIREARRMVSDYVNTELDCRRLRKTPESVGLGSYNMDSHNVQRYVDANGHVRNEGDIQISPGGPYAISYRAIRPKAEECANLLVPVCLSSSHIAFGSIRMEPVFMVLGQSAATAAVHAIEDGVTVQEVDYGKLKRRLLADGQVLEFHAPPRPTSGSLAVAPSSLKGIVVDDANAKLKGEWTSSRSVGPLVGSAYRHDGNEEKGRKSARFEAKLPKAGRYDVRLAYTAHSNRSASVPVTIHHLEGSKTVRVNQQRRPDLGPFVSLGTYSFGTDRPAAVVVSNEGTTGHVIIDAVQFLPVR